MNLQNINNFIDYVDPFTTKRSFDTNLIMHKFMTYIPSLFDGLSISVDYDRNNEVVYKVSGDRIKDENFLKNLYDLQMFTVSYMGSVYTLNITADNENLFLRIR